MIRALQLVATMHQWLTRFYPRSFRAEFGEEMAEVFFAAASDAASNGHSKLFGIFLRELADFPWVTLSEHWLNLRRSLGRVVGPSPSARFSAMGSVDQRRYPMDQVNDIDLLHLKDRRSALLSGLPFALLGLGIGLTAAIYQGPWYLVPAWRLYLSIGLGMVPIAAIGVGALVALYRRVPDWGWTWLGTAFMGCVLFVMTLVDEMADEGMPLTTPAGEAVILILLLVIGGTVIGVAAMRGWRRAGLVSLGLAGTLGLSLFISIIAAPFNRTDLALLAVPCGVIVAWLVYHYGRGSDALRLAITLGLGSMNLGLIVIADRVWMEWLTERGSGSPLIPFLVLSVLMLLVGPIAAWILKPIQRTLRRA